MTESDLLLIKEALRGVVKDVLNETLSPIKKELETNKKLTAKMVLEVRETLGNLLNEGLVEKPVQYSAPVNNRQVKEQPKKWRPNLDVQQVHEVAAQQENNKSLLENLKPSDRSKIAGHNPLSDGELPDIEVDPTIFMKGIKKYNPVLNEKP